MFLYGLEYFFLNRPVFYFDENYFYKVTRKDPAVRHKLSDVIEVRKTNVMINNRRVWKVIIDELGQQTGYRMRSNFGDFDLFLEKIKENPRNFIAQPTITLSTSPCVIGDELEGRHVDLRPYILYGEDIYVTPGGLTRVALKKGSLVVNSSQGGGSKDTWVLK